MTKSLCTVNATTRKIGLYRVAVEKTASLGFFDKRLLALRGAFGNGSGK